MPSNNTKQYMQKIDMTKFDRRSKRINDSDYNDISTWTIKSKPPKPVRVTVDKPVAKSVKITPAQCLMLTLLVISNSPDPKPPQDTHWTADLFI
jgi:hypothetical protein